MKVFYIFALVLCSFLAGCGCNANRPSPRNHYYTDYVGSQSYILKQPVFISTKSSFLLKVGDSGEGAFPSTLEEFQKNPAAWDADLLSAGITLKVSKINYTYSFDAGPTIWIHAEIADGKLAGKKCMLNFISTELHKKSPLIDVPMIDTNIMELVGKP
jgi:hypothetical protein